MMAILNILNKQYIIYSLLPIMIEDVVNSGSDEMHNQAQQI